MDELRESRAAHAESAAAAERGRVAREMHDVLAHSLSALALQLEGTRLLARDRGGRPRGRRGDRARPPPGRRGARRGARRDRRAARRRAAGPGARRAARRGLSGRLPRHGHAARRASCPPRRGWPSTGPRRRRSPTCCATATPTASRSSSPTRTTRTRLVVEDHGPGAPVTVGAAPRRRLRADGDARAGRAARRAADRGADGGRLPRGAVAAGVIRVLLADDQRVVREGLGTLLGLLEGIELVGTAADGEEAVALAAEHDPDVVLMDLRMPRVDGVEAIRRLTARGERPRAIALTTYADDASVARRAARRRPRLPDQGRRRRADPRRGRRRWRAARRRSTRRSSTTCWPR